MSEIQSSRSKHVLHPFVEDVRGRHTKAVARAQEEIPTKQPEDEEWVEQGPSDKAVPVAPVPEPKFIAASPRPVKKPAKKPRKKRPSMSEQLQAIARASDENLSQIRMSFNVPDPNKQEQNFGRLLLDCSTNSLRVGRISSKYPSLVSFYSSCCKYSFYKTTSVHVDMLMYYGDMQDVQLVAGSLNKFSFKIPHPLEKFNEDYNYNNRQHRLEMRFNSALDFDKFKELVYPVISEAAQPEF